MASPQEQSPSAVSAELLVQLARYANLALLPERAAQLAPLLAAPLDVARALQPEGYADLQPASVYRVPRGA